MASQLLTITGRFLPARILSSRFHLGGPSRAVTNDQPPVNTSVISDRPINSPSVFRYALPAEYGKLPRTLYGGRHTVAMLLGDGIGPEMMGHVKTIFRIIGAPVDFEEIEINACSDESAIREAILAIQRNGIAIKGSLETRPGKWSKNITIRNNLDLFAYIQHCYSFPGVQTRHSNVNIIVIRENTEGEYSQLEHESVPGVVESLKIITRSKSERIARFAFDYATRCGRKKITAVHKANIMKLGDGLFLNTCADVAKLYPKIEFDSLIVDNCCMQMVSRPHQFDVVLLPNLYGNIVGNLAAGLVGGAGLSVGINLGERHALFEAGSRKSARKLTGKDIANPCALLLASVEALDYLGHEELAKVMRSAIIETTVEGIRTQDIGGINRTSEVIASITKRLAAKLEKTA